MIMKTKAFFIVMAASVFFGTTAAFATTTSTTPRPLDPVDVSVSIEGFKIINLNGIGRFGNDELKQRILTQYEEAVYNIPRLQYSIMGHTIRASDVHVYVDPTRIDDVRTRLNIQAFADSAEVTGPLINRNYGDPEINSLSGIYNSNSDKLIINVPHRTALSILLQ
jgi:hypothetical protein